MTVLVVRKAPDPVLLKKANLVAKIDASIQRLIVDMFETMWSEHGLGLAANQIGVPLRVLVMGIPEEDEATGETSVREYVLINAELIKQWDEQEMEEGCLSIPGYRGKLKRFNQVKVKGLDRDGKKVRMKAEGLLAQALQHEIDHLNGVLYVDRMKEQGTLETLSEVAKRTSDDTQVEESDQPEAEPRTAQANSAA